MAGPLASDKWFVDTWGCYGKDDAQFDHPTCVAVGSDSEIYVVDQKNHRVQCFTLDGVFIRKWGEEGRTEGQFRYPHGICIYKNSRQTLLEALKIIPDLSIFPPGLLPICVSYVAEHIYITDMCNCRVQVFDSYGTFIRKLGSSGDRNGEFDAPEGCDADVSGSIYIADTFNHRIQVFTPEGKFIRKWGTRGSKSGQYDLPTCISVSRSGVVFVGDSASVTSCRVDGLPFHQKARLRLSCPFGIQVDDEARVVYIVERNEHCVHEFRMDLTFYQKWGHFGYGHGRF